MLNRLKALMRREKNTDNTEDRVDHWDQPMGTECKEPLSACSIVNMPQKNNEKKRNE